MDLDRHFSRAELERLAALSDGPRAPLIAHQAAAFLRMEALQQQRAAKEARERQAYEASEERRLARAVQPPRPVVVQSRGFTERQVRTLARLVGPELDALGKRLHKVEAQSPAAATDGSAVQAHAAHSSTPAAGVAVVDPVVARYIEQRVSSTERLVKALDASSLRYEGVWQSQRVYRKGAAVTHQGGMWLAIEDCDLRPGQDSNWKLVVKSGAAPQPGKRTTEEKTEDHAFRLKEIEKAMKKLEEETAWKMKT